MKASIRAGLKPDEFWDMTLREAALYCEGAIHRVIESAWWGELMARQKKLKKSPDLYISGPDDQSAEEQEKILRAIFEPMVKK